MKVIFLDIDGVLNTEEFLATGNGAAIDRSKVEILKEIVENTEAEIVMSSGWRLWFDEELMPEDGLSQELYDILCEYGLELYDKTPDYSTEEIRTRRTFSVVKAKEILAWLEENEEVQNYVVLDDLDLGDGVIAQHLVRTDGKVGLSLDDAAEVIRRLNQ